MAGSEIHAIKTQVPLQAQSYSMKLANEGGIFFQAAIWKDSERGAAVEVWHKSQQIGYDCQTYRLSDHEWTKFDSTFRSLRFSKMPENARPYALHGNAWWWRLADRGRAIALSGSTLNPPGRKAISWN